MASNRPAGVTFDYWNTLVVVGGGRHRSQRVDAWVGCLADHDVVVTAQAVATAMERQATVLDQRWKAGQHYAPRDVVADTATALGLDDPSIVEALVEVQDESSLRTPLQLAPGVAGVLRRFHAAGIRLGIVCDVGASPSPVLRGHLERHDLLSYFDAWAFSDEVGVYKPDERLFLSALDRMGVAPDEAAHVGDLLRTDVAGARALGMTSVRYAGLFDDGAAEAGFEADHLIDHHDQLPTVLGIPT